MIVIDASAAVAILQNEPERDRLSATLLSSEERYIHPVSHLEVVMALSRRYRNPAPVAVEFLRRAQIQLCTIDGEYGRWAQHAFLHFGKGRHAARLNLGDCFSYAAAKVLDAPLLFVGNDFPLTDIRAA